MFFEKNNNWTGWDFMNAKTPVLLACSGGKDSMALLHFLYEQKQNIGVAHCNFQLRGDDADGDAAFVARFCNERDIPFFCQSFETAVFAEDHKMSIQAAARLLRYDWLEEIRKVNRYEFIITAHHLNDQFETMLFHFIKGSGLKGLVGMERRNGNIIRPLLEVAVTEIELYLQENKIAFRTDVSNASSKYDRNFIRHQIVPLFERINPIFLENIPNFSRIMSESEALLNDDLTKLWKRHSSEKDGQINISIGILRKHFATRTILHYWLTPFGLNTTQITALNTAIANRKKGIEYFSKSHQFFLEQNHLFITPLNLESTPVVHYNKLPKQIVFNGTKIKISIVPISELNRKDAARYAYFDESMLSFPITIRYINEGDYFYPFGMNKPKSVDKLGKKKVSKFFKDINLPQIERAKVPILLFGDKIIWVVGHRIDGRFAITDNTKSVVKMVIVDE